MQPTKTTHVTTFILAVILLIIGIFGLTYFARFQPMVFGPSSTAAEPAMPLWPSAPGVVAERATLTGVQVCLPHRDTTGPQTLGCAIGMKTTDGKYYALDFNLMSQNPPTIPNGKTFTASGILTPAEALSSDQWQKYNMQGILSVTDSVVIHN